MIANSKAVDLFSLHSVLEAKAFLLSPTEPGVLILLKHTKEKSRKQLCFLDFFNCGVRGQFESPYNQGG